MTIKPYALMADPLEALYSQENLSSLAKNADENSSRKLQIECSKTDQVAKDILEISGNNNTNNILDLHPIIESLNDEFGTEKEFFIQAIDCNSQDGSVYNKLANLLENGETIQLLSGKIYTNKELYLKAIDLNPQDINPYYNLAYLLENNETIQLLSGEIYTNKELYLKAIDLNPQDVSPYNNLAYLLENSETIQLLSGEIYTNKELYLKAIDLDPQDVSPYNNLAYLLENSETIQLLNGETYTNKELYLKAIDLNPQDVNLYTNLANLLGNSETIQLLSKETYTNKELYLKAIDLNPQDVNLYNNLAYLLENSETIQLLSGETYTNKELYLKAIDLNPQDVNPYTNLANLLGNNETIQLLNGEIYTNKELYLKTIDLNPKYEDSYTNLANLLGNSETIQLLNGEAYTNKELYIKAIELNPKGEIPYINLANLLARDETVQLLNGEVYTNKKLYIKAIELNPKGEIPYINLADLLARDETVQLLNGEVYTNKKLYVKAIELNPKDDCSYTSLAHLLTKNETITFLSGEIYTSKELYLKAIKLNPKNLQAYTILAHLLEKDETVQLLNEKAYTKKEIYLKAIDSHPQHECFYSTLTNLLKDDEPVTLLNGEIYTKKKLYLKAIDLNPTNEANYANLADLLTDDESVQFLNRALYTKKELYLKATDLESVTHMSSRAMEYLQHFYIQEIGTNPEKIENYFNLITVMQHGTVYLQNGMKVDSAFYFREALRLDPTSAFSSRFAKGVFSVASDLSNQVERILQQPQEMTVRNGSYITQILKGGAYLELEHDKKISIRALYEHALPFLSSVYLKHRGEEKLGDYLSSRKHIVLQDGVKFTKLMAYTYAHQKKYTSHILGKLGDATHPEKHFLLNEQCYDKRTLYQHAKQYNTDITACLRMAESLYPHEWLRKEELFHSILDQVSQLREFSWEAITIFVRILSQYELTGLASKYLLIFEERIKGLNRPEECYPIPANEYYKDSEISDKLYFIKKQELLLYLFKYMPDHEEMYVAFARSFESPVMIHEKNYASKEALYLKAIDINPEYSLPYFLLGKELFHQNIKSIQLLNGVTLSCKQLFMRAIQLGTYEAEAYHLAAIMMDDREGILLFDEKTILSRGDLFIRAFELDFTRIMDFKNFISYIKRNKKLTKSG